MIFYIATKCYCYTIFYPLASSTLVAGILISFFDTSLAAYAIQVKVMTNIFQVRFFIILGRILEALLTRIA